MIDWRARRYGNGHSGFGGEGLEKRRNLHGLLAGLLPDPTLISKPRANL